MEEAVDEEDDVEDDEEEEEEEEEDPAAGPLATTSHLAILQKTQLVWLLGKLQGVKKTGSKATLAKVLEEHGLPLRKF